MFRRSPHPQSPFSLLFPLVVLLPAVLGWACAPSSSPRAETPPAPRGSSDDATGPVRESATPPPPPAPALANPGGAQEPRPRLHVNLQVEGANQQIATLWAEAAALERELQALEAGAVDEVLFFESPPPALAQRRARAVPQPRAKKAPIPDPSPEEPEPQAGNRPGLAARGADGADLGGFPLRRTSVAAEISGRLARTRMRQEYANPFSEPIEAVYAFPLPSRAAVTDFLLESGGRRIVGLVRPREEARELYRQARERGYTASLLTQERPNLFTQSVANVEPGGDVAVELTFFERLESEAGVLEWVFPTVVGPRYVAGAPRRPDGAREAREVEPAGGTGPATDRVPDGHRLTPPVLRDGEDGGHRLDLSVTVRSPVPIRDLVVPTHRVRVEAPDPTQRLVFLAPDDGRLDRDFVLRFRLAGETTELGLVAHRRTGDGTFLLSVEPPLEPGDDQVMAREITFVLDVSGSMTGLPLDLARALVDLALDGLRPDDRFNLLTFASGSAQLWPEPRAGTPQNLAVARRFLETLEGGGGTEMLAGVGRALAAAHDPSSLRIVVFLTDGFVGEEAAILRLIGEERGEARFFAFGIGSSVNRFLVEGIGEHGGGSSQVVLPRAGEVERSARLLLERIDAPVLVDLEVDWGDLPVEQVVPRRLPDLWAGAGLDLIGRYRVDDAAREPIRGRVVVSGRRGGRPVRFELDVELPAQEEAHAVLAPVWARHTIHDLQKRLATATPATREALEAEITDLALEHRLASAFTSFVAVDESRVVGGDRPLRILQPVELPEGVDRDGVFGESSESRAVEVAAWGVRLGETSGRLSIVDLDPGGEAARSGVRAGARLLAVDTVAVRDLGHLRSLLLQAPGPTVPVRLEPGGEVWLTLP